MGSITDIVVIGGGPAGLSAAINAIARGKSVRVFKSSESYLSKAERVDNYLGFYNINGTDIINAFEKHIADMGIEIEDGKAINIMPFGDNFLVNINNDIIEAKAVILATGVQKQRPIDGEQRLLGKGVSYCATCDGMLYRGKRVIVYGDDVNIAKEAEFLSSIGVNVVFVTQKNPPKLNDGIRVITGKINRVLGDDHVTGVEIGENTVDTDAVFFIRDSIAPAALISGLTIEKGYISTDRGMNTNIPGVFACGDCAGKPLQLAKAVGEGLIAAQNAAHYIDTKEKV